MVAGGRERVNQVPFGRTTGLEDYVRLAIILLIVPALAACEKAADKPDAAKPGPGTTTAGAPNTPKKTKPEGEPDRVSVKHVLIAYKGATRATATRSKDEARELAKQILLHASNGAPFEELMAKHTDDQGSKDGKAYDMANHGVAPAAPGESARSGMATAFGDVGFKLAVGEVGLADPDKMDSPFGFHIIKRMK